MSCTQPIYSSVRKGTWSWGGDGQFAPHPAEAATVGPPYPSLQKHVSEVGRSLLQRQKDLGQGCLGTHVLSLRLLSTGTHVAFRPSGHKIQRVN